MRSLASWDPGVLSWRGHLPTIRAQPCHVTPLLCVIWVSDLSQSVALARGFPGL